MSDTIEFPLHDVQIDRGTMVITTEVPKHEIKVLEAVHGVDGQVKDMGENGDQMIVSSNADDEWNRLNRKYKRLNTPDPAGIAYRAGPSALKDFGFALDRAKSQAAPQAGVRNHKRPAKPTVKQGK